LHSHLKDYNPATRASDFVFTMSNFRLRVVNLQPSEESFGVLCLRSSDGVSSLDFGPAFQRGFFYGYFGKSAVFFPASVAGCFAAPISVESPTDSEKKSQCRQITRNAF
jgi:hypothetical protein